MNNPREEEIQRLCNSVLSVEADYCEDDRIGRTTCPMCWSSATDNYIKLKMSDIKHDQDCPYLLAQGLSS